MNIYEILRSIANSLAQIEVSLQQLKVVLTPPVATKITFIVGGQEETKMQVQDNQTVAISIAAEDVDGNPTVLDPASVLVWSVDNAAMATIAPAATGQGAVVTPSGTLGSFNAQLSIAAVNAQPAIQGTLAVTVVASGATQVVLTGAVS
jgi:hypothetical protein